MHYVAGDYRINPLSTYLSDGDSTVIVHYADGRKIGYPNIKYPDAFIRKIRNNSDDIIDIIIK